MLSLFTGCGKPPEAPKPTSQAVQLELQSLGGAAGSLLKSDVYTQLTVEVASVSGRSPAPSTLDYLKTFLGARLNKPDGINVVLRDGVIPASGSSGLGPDDLANIESAYRTQYASGNKMSVFIMFLDNHSVSDTADARILGMAYRATSIVVFEDTLRSETSGLAVIDRPLVEKTVISHEFGHILGLVNVGTTMQTDHYDLTHNPGHCSNPNCLMNYAVNTSRLLDAFNGEVPTFDDACLADLRAAGGK